MTDAPLTFDAVQVGSLYTRAELAGLLKLTEATLSRKKWTDRIEPIRMGGRVMYPGERIIAYFVSIGWEKPAPRKPLSPAQVQRRVKDATARSLAAA